MTATILGFHTRTDKAISLFRRIEGDITSLDDWKRNRLNKLTHINNTPSLRAASVEFIVQGDDRTTLVLCDDALRIRTTGFFGTREQTIPVRSIAAVNVAKRAGIGSIQFSSVASGSRRMWQGAPGAVMDEGLFVFRGDDRYEIALMIKHYIEKAPQTLRRGPRPSLLSGKADIVNRHMARRTFTALRTLAGTAARKLKQQRGS
jgi:hypothetical protein